MQTVSSGWAHNVAKAQRFLGAGALISWLKTTASGVNFFTINQSRIGGNDIIKSGGVDVTFFDKWQFGDYSDDLISFTVSRNLGQFPYGIIMAEADLSLRNTSRKFLPNHDSTIGSGILPNRPMKLTIGVEDEYIKLFSGYSLMPENSLVTRVTRLHAFDVFDFINGYNITYSGAMTDVYAHEVYEEVLTQMGFTSSQYVLDSSLNGPIGYIAPNNMKAGDLFSKLVEAEQAMLFADENGIIRHWNRQHFTTTSGVIAFELNYSSIEDIQYQNTAIINDVRVLATPRTVRENQYLTGLEDGYIEIGGTQTVEQFFEFKDLDGELPVSTVDTPQAENGSPSQTSVYEAFANSDGSGTNRTADVEILSVYNFGTRYRVTMRNNAATTLYVTVLDIWGTPAKISNQIEERYQDETSIDLYGRNPANNNQTIEIENDYISDSDTAYSLAYTLVNEYKDPRKRFIVPIAVGSNPALQIGDFGYLTVEDTGETKSVWIVGIDNEYGPGPAEYTQILELEERDIRRYFTINSSRIGGTDSIAP